MLIYCWVLPDGAAASVQVVSRHRADNGSRRGVFIHIHGVRRSGEDGRFINIQDAHFDRCGVLKGPQVQEAGVQLCIRRLNLEDV